LINQIQTLRTRLLHQVIQRRQLRSLLHSPDDLKAEPLGPEKEEEEVDQSPRLLLPELEVYSVEHSVVVISPLKPIAPMIMSRRIRSREVPVSPVSVVW
jgi:hypothetical protein